jgi:hypothetical protein
LLVRSEEQRPVSVRQGRIVADQPFGDWRRIDLDI